MFLKIIGIAMLLLIGTNDEGTTCVEATAARVSLKILPTTTTDSGNSNSGDEMFVQFLKHLNQEQNFTTIVILTNWSNKNRKQRDYCLNLKYYMEYEQHQQQLQYDLIPIILLQSKKQDNLLHDKFHCDFLTIICIPPFTSHQILHNELLPALSKNLWFLHKNRVIIRMDMRSHHKNEIVKKVTDILRYCDVQQIINIIIISYQFPYNDLEYYSYSKFPAFQVKKQLWTRAKTQLFPNQLSDVKGYTLLTIPDQIEPRSILYFDKNGQAQMTGNMAHFVKYFAKSINATLAFAFDVKAGEKLIYRDILNLTLNHTVELPASLGAPDNVTDWPKHSYPHEISCWCFILPVEAELTPAEIFLAVMSPEFIMILITLCICFTFLVLIVLRRNLGPLYRFFWVDLLLNDKAFRAVLGQGFSFTIRKLDYFVAYVFLLLFLTGLMVVTLYGVLLGSYMTSPPKKPSIKSLEDLDKSSTKLLIIKEDLAFINRTFYGQYHNLFHVVERDHFWREHKRFNTSYAYPLTFFLWQVVAEQQKRFSRPLFRYSTDLCFRPHIHYNPFLTLHSVFREPLHFATLNVYASGLYYHWNRLGFYELVSLGRMSFGDLTKPLGVKPIIVSDLKIIFVGFVISLLCSAGIFALELFVMFLKKYILRRYRSQN